MRVGRSKMGIADDNSKTYRRWTISALVLTVASVSYMAFQQMKRTHIAVVGAGMLAVTVILFKQHRYWLLQLNSRLDTQMNRTSDARLPNPPRKRVNSSNSNSSKETSPKNSGAEKNEFSILQECDNVLKTTQQSYDSEIQRRSNLSKNSRIIRISLVVAAILLTISASRQLIPTAAVISGIVLILFSAFKFRTRSFLPLVQPTSVNDCRNLLAKEESDKSKSEFLLQLSLARGIAKRVLTEAEIVRIFEYHLMTGEKASIWRGLLDSLAPPNTISK